ncbi:hypothetical protein ACIQPQ_10815 [Streptomyces sp. NPDC091281]|uniref:hypothetical protein n=1 Tax=Streptomyces sp. NPDC091281 TaxID=3365985 RepID=UPI00382F97C1
MQQRGLDEAQRGDDPMWLRRDMPLDLARGESGGPLWEFVRQSWRPRLLPGGVKLLADLLVNPPQGLEVRPAESEGGSAAGTRPPGWRRISTSTTTKVVEPNSAFIIRTGITASTACGGARPLRRGCGQPAGPRPLVGANLGDSANHAAWQTRCAGRVRASSTCRHPLYLGKSGATETHQFDISASSLSITDQP